MAVDLFQRRVSVLGVQVESRKAHALRTHRGAAVAERQGAQALEAPRHRRREAPLAAEAGGSGSKAQIAYGPILAGDQYIHCEITRERLHRRFDAKAVASYDFGRTLQVLTNLLSNAAKFSPPGGTINVLMERKSGRIRVSVQDFGPGIPRESQKRIFERFAQVAKATNSAVASTGLGLHISRAIMEQQQGTIGLDSEEGVGSTFYIEFPAVNHELSAKEKQVGFAG